MTRKTWREVLDETVPKGSLATTPSDFDQRVAKERRHFPRRTESEANVEKVFFSEGDVALRVLVDAEEVEPRIIEGYSGTPIAIPQLTINGVPVQQPTLRDPQRSPTSGKIALTLGGSVATSAMPDVRSMPLSITARLTVDGPLFQAFKVIFPQS
jgi:hypothetical protein